jgi:predicted nucleic acid-binding protein
VIVVDTGGVLALLDRDDRHHTTVRDLFDAEGQDWILPWAILPEVDYLAGKYLGRHVADMFVKDLREGLFRVDSSFGRDILRAQEIIAKYHDLGLGLVDAVVMAEAERHGARAIVTTDLRHFRAVKLRISPAPPLYPADR